MYATEEYTLTAYNDEVYVGLFVCAHNKDVVEKVVYDNVRITKPAREGFTKYPGYIGSHIETMDVMTGKRIIEYSEPVSLQAPNWTTNGKTLIYNSNGLIYTLHLTNKKPVVLNTGTM